MQKLVLKIKFTLNGLNIPLLKAASSIDSTLCRDKLSIFTSSMGDLDKRS